MSSGKTYTFITGSTAVIECNISSNPPVSSIAWYKTDGQTDTPIAIDGIKYTGGQTSSPHLIISQLDSDDQGYYICKASNSVGTGSSGQSYLTVSGSKFP